jgi:peptidoglycan/LPS O-acetylase OafA/YrhL
MLKWKMQFACAVVWLASAVIASFGSENATSIAFLGATFICQIVFGIYAMICDARQRRQQSGVVNA